MNRHRQLVIEGVCCALVCSATGVFMVLAGIPQLYVAAYVAVGLSTCALTATKPRRS
jgi:hypothetical protein